MYCIVERLFCKRAIQYTLMPLYRLYRIWHHLPLPLSAIMGKRYLLHREKKEQESGTEDIDMAGGGAINIPSSYRICCLLP
jgi:hypothetical protein